MYVHCTISQVRIYMYMYIMYKYMYIHLNAYTVILFSLACLSKKVCLKNIHLVGWCVHRMYIHALGNLEYIYYIHVCMLYCTDES